ncbi:hypothetical protein WME79_48465 [Sorangium sp. So ce726]|uniref:hypothetical protein n=1 Tax=Sorangium sp. So ce726 TaxID=3133319 RepID=UPI003F60DFFC
MAIAGYLETYIAQVSTAALESHPSLLFGGSTAIDGAIFLKKNPQYDLYPYTEDLVRGDWQARISAYRTFFGTCPFEQHTSDLEKLRKLRNDTGHSFGRDIKSMRFASTSTVERLKAVPDKTIQGYLALAEAVADAIEKQLGKAYVGQYELIKLYHLWIRAPVARPPELKLLARQFSLHVRELTMNGYGIESAMRLIAYYRSL